MENEKLLTTRLMANRLQVSMKWLKAEATAGRLPHVRAGTVLLFDPQAVEELLLERARQGQGGRP
jgi:hypothetical protein